ncbi:YceD family protein [Clostridium thermarum]|uniref:YceD family protein n=1 Tax=Clostridium thermarum TaxID=1716543 RepID=UPI001120485B|nr:DUF177 domain-containing protein [Clostridium thermarum]
MYININDLSNKKNSSKEINVSLKPDMLFIGNSEIKTNKEIVFSGVTGRVDEMFYLDGKLSGELILMCSRCLEDFIYPIDIEIHEKFSAVPNDEDESVIFIDSDIINLTELIENNILMSLPIKKLCSEDCQGLCQSCGCNLNKKTCNCDNGNVDPRLEKLKELFFTE